MGTASDYVRIDRPMHGFRHHVPPFKGFYDPVCSILIRYYLSYLYSVSLILGY